MKDCVYEVICNICRAIYGGGTKQMICKRCYQHHHGGSGEQESAVWKHCQEEHEGVWDTSIRVVSKTNGYVHRHIREAVHNWRHINNLPAEKNMNRRIEGNGTVNLHF